MSRSSFENDLECVVDIFHGLLSYIINLRQNTHTAMGWLRLVGSLKLYVSFAEYRLFYRAFLQKRPMIIRSLLVVATP